MDRVAVAALALGVFFFLFSGCKKSSTEPTDGGTSGTPTSVTESEPNDVTPQALGTLGSSEITVSGTAANDKDIDRFSLALAGTTNLFVKVAWQGTSDLDLGIKNSVGIPITFRDTGGNPETCGLASSPGGSYILEVTSKQTSSTAYTLTVGKR